MATPIFTVRPSDAAQAYGRVESGDFGAVTGSANNTQGGFGAAIQQAIGEVVGTSRAAETQARQAIAGHADLTEVVTQVNKAELAIQTTMAIRDRVISAYQDVMRMAI